MYLDSSYKVEEYSKRNQFQDITKFPQNPAVNACESQLEYNSKIESSHRLRSYDMTCTRFNTEFHRLNNILLIYNKFNSVNITKENELI